MKCPACGKDTRGVTSRRTGNIYSPCCAAVVGRAFLPSCDKAGPSTHENILQIIRIVTARDKGLLSRAECEAQVQAVITREPELPLKLHPVHSS